MTVLVDTGVIYAHHDERATRHDKAVSAFESLLRGEYGRPYVSDHIFDEAVTLTRARTGSFEAADTVARRLLGEGSYPTRFDVLDVGPGALRDSVETFRRYADHELSFTDATTVAFCERRDIDAVLSFDSDFDGLIERIEPGR